MPEGPEIIGLDALVDKFGTWPLFHDSEVLRIALDRSGPSMTLDLLVPDKRELKGAQYEVQLSFSDIDTLQLSDFNYQNVIFSITTERVTERRFATGNVEHRIRIAIDSVFGAQASFTCKSASVVRIVASNLRTGSPRS